MRGSQNITISQAMEQDNGSTQADSDCSYRTNGRMLRSRRRLFVNLICCGALIGAATPGTARTRWSSISRPRIASATFRPLEAFGSTVDKDPGRIDAGVFSRTITFA